MSVGGRWIVGHRHLSGLECQFGWAPCGGRDGLGLCRAMEGDNCKTNYDHQGRFFLGGHPGSFSTEAGAERNG